MEKYIIEKAWSENSISQIVGRYYQTAQPPLGRLKVLFSDISSIYLVKHSNAMEKLNDYIIAETTVRQPTESSPDEMFYFEVKADSDAFLSSFDLTPSDAKVKTSSNDTLKVVRSMMERLTMV